MSHRRSNTPNPPSTWFQPANKPPLRLKLTKRFLSTNQKTFSRLMQCHTRHAHTGEYYKCFVPTQEISCPCRARLQTQQHITSVWKNHSDIGTYLEVADTQNGEGSLAQSKESTN